MDALEGLLATRPFAEISVAEIASAASVSRSAFYFYFPTKAAAAAALMAGFYEELTGAAGRVFEDDDGDPLDRLREGIVACSELWQRRGALVTAMLDAVGADVEVREVWDGWLRGFSDLAAGRILKDQKAGLIDPVLDASTIAPLLMSAAIETMERDARAIAAGEKPVDGLHEAVVQIWHRTLYRAT